MFRVLLRQIGGSEVKSLRAQTHHQEGAGHDVIEVALLIPQPRFSSRPMSLPSSLQTSPTGSGEGIGGGNVAAHFRL